MIKSLSVYRGALAHRLYELNNFIFLNPGNISKNAKMAKKQKKAYKEFWNTKYKQLLELEKSRIIIDDEHYLIDKRDGFLCKLS